MHEELVMKFTIPLPLQREHEALHGRLRHATQAGGEVGEDARTLARLMHPHFVKEDQIALPPLGLLVELARGGASAGIADVLELTDRLEAELPQMLEEHRGIVTALDKLRASAERAGRADIVEFAQALTEHARIEEEVMYPAALLVGQVVRQRLGSRVPGGADDSGIASFAV
jgi:iron-sulfur cluster repair protein YtfE (RIC family)